MSRFTKLFTANAIAAAGLCSAAIAMSPSAVADPGVVPEIPGVPALGMLQQLATNPAGAAALLQTAATALTGAGGALTAPATLPVSPIQGVPDVALPAGAPTAPPGALAVSAPSTAASGSLLPIPLLNQLGIPANLANLSPNAMPFPVAVGSEPGLAPAPSAAPVGVPAGIPPATTIPPASAPPVMPIAPGAGLGQLLPLGALP